MKHIIFIVIFITHINNLFAEFKTGYIIKNNGDSISGYLQNLSEVELSKYVIFKKSDTASTIEYLPGQIKSFRFLDDKYFISATLTYTGEPKKVFLEWLLKGKANLLAHYNDVSDTRFFIQQEDSSFYELKNSKNEIEKDYAKYVVEKKEYRGSLSYFFRDAPPVKEKINVINFDRNSLIEITKDYHNYVCPDQECEIFVGNKWKPRLSVGLNMDYHISNISIPYEAYIDPTQGIGIGVQFCVSNLPLVSKNLSIQTGIHYTNNSFEYDKNKVPRFYPPITDFELFKLNIVRVPILIKYGFNFKYVSPFIALGPSFVFRSAKVPGNDYLVNKSIKGTWPKNTIFSPFNYSYNVLAGFSFNINSNYIIEYSFSYERMNDFFGGFPSDITSQNVIRNSISVLYNINNKSRP